MRGMVLAAGFGSRLRPLTDSTPKPLIEVGGEPMIHFALRLLASAGIRDVAINLHHLGSQIRERLGDGSRLGLRLSYSEEDPILDTGGGIAAARRFLDGDTFVLANSDTFIDLDLAAVVAAHRRQRAFATLVLRPDPAAVRRDDIGIDAEGRIRRFLGHGAAAEGLRRCMYPGVMVLDPGIFSYFGSGPFSLTRDTFPRILAAGERLYGFVHEGYWRVLDTHEDLAAGRAEIPALLARRSAGVSSPVP